MSRLTKKQIKGYIDAITYELGVEIQLMGIQFGEFYGTLREGLRIEIEVSAVSGTLQFYLENGNEAWINQDFAVRFGGAFSSSEKLLNVQSQGENILFGQGKGPMLSKI